jgi:hypothetical protein
VTDESLISVASSELDMAWIEDAVRACETTVGVADLFKLVQSVQKTQNELLVESAHTLGYSWSASGTAIKR